jgi:hypothetical protein
VGGETGRGGNGYIVSIYNNNNNNIKFKKE